jgi:hypothetical protein
MQKKKMVMGFLFVSISSFIGGAVIRPLSPCQKLDSKISVAEQFCQKMSDDYAFQVCSPQTDDERVLKMCESMIQPVVLAKCLEKAEVPKMRNDLLNFCGV